MSIQSTSSKCDNTLLYKENSSTHTNNSSLADTTVVSELDVVAKRKMAAIARLDEISNMGDCRINNFEPDPAILIFDLDAILKNYNKDYSPFYLCKLLGWAGIDKNKSQAFNNVMQKYDVHSSGSEQERMVQTLLSQMFSFFDQRIGHSGHSENDLKEQFQEIVDKIIDADEDCVDQMLSQLQGMMLDLVADGCAATQDDKALQRIRFRAGHALAQYRSNLLMQICVRQNPNEEHMADLERVVMQKLANVLGLRGGVFDAGAQFGRFVDDINGKVALVINAFQDEYKPLTFLANELKTPFSTVRKLRTDFIQWATENYAIDDEDDKKVKDTDMNRLLSADYDAGTTGPFSYGGDWTPAATLLLMEATGLIHQIDKKPLPMPIVQEEQVHSNLRAMQTAEEWTAIQQTRNNPNELPIAQEQNCSPNVQSISVAPLPAPTNLHPEPIDFLSRLQQDIRNLVQETCRALSSASRPPTIPMDNYPVAVALRQLIADQTVLDAANALVQALAAASALTHDQRTLLSLQTESALTLALILSLASRDETEHRTTRFYEAFKRRITELTVDENSMDFGIFAGAANRLITHLGMGLQENLRTGQIFHSPGAPIIDRFQLNMLAEHLPLSLEMTNRIFNHRIFDDMVNVFANQPLESITIESMKQKIASIKTFFSGDEIADIEVALRRAIKFRYGPVAIDTLRGHFANLSDRSPRMQGIIAALSASQTAERDALVNELNVMRGPNGFGGTINAAFEALRTAEAEKNAARAAYFVANRQIVPSNDFSDDALRASLIAPMDRRAVEGAKQTYIQKYQEFVAARRAFTAIKARFDEIAVFTGRNITGGRIAQLNANLAPTALANQARAQARKLAAFYGELNETVGEGNKIARSMFLNQLFA